MKKLAALLVAVFCLSSLAFAAPVMNIQLHKNVTVTKEAGSKEAGSKAVVTKTKIVKVKSVKVKHLGKGLTKKGTSEAGPKK